MKKYDPGAWQDAQVGRWPITWLSPLEHAVKYHEHSPQVKFGPKFLLIDKINWKARDMCCWQNLTSLEKSDNPVWDSGYSDFDNFRVKIGKRENMRKIEDQVCLRHGKGDRRDKEQMKRRLNPKGWSHKNW
jgi:hypothetical protein